MANFLKLTEVGTKKHILVNTDFIVQIIKSLNGNAILSRNEYDSMIGYFLCDLAVEEKFDDLVELLNK